MKDEYRIWFLPALIGLQLSLHRLHDDLRAGATGPGSNKFNARIKRRGPNRVNQKSGPGEKQ